MTNNQLTDEQIAQLLGHACMVIGDRFATVDELSAAKAIRALAVELQERRKAAIDSEPVAYTDERNLGYIDRGRETAYLWGKQNSEAADVPLYRHAQQPVVPEEKPMPNPLSMYAVDAVAAIAEVKGWNACRAAMLAAAPQEAK
ncbi:hypothetical protein [Klebsiella oxytoca]|uniref:hypothetical protein n=1 Tax=Klebsiella oxytoca TaxID=571 RepID=UPI0034D2C44B